MIEIELYTLQELATEGIQDFFQPQDYLIEAVQMDSSDILAYFIDLYKSRYTIFNASQLYSNAIYLFAANKYKYETLAATLGLEYNPIENYDMTETTTYNRNQTQTEESTQTIRNNQIITVNNDNTKRTNQIATTNTTADSAENFDELTHGETITKGGQDETTTTHKVNPYDNAGDLNESSDTTVFKPTSTDTHGGSDTTRHGVDETITTTYSMPEGSTAAGDTDNTTTTTTYSMPEGSTAEGDTVTNKIEKYYEGENPDTTVLTRHGNIGVTTSQQMIQSERELASFNLLQIVFNDLCEKLFVSNIY